MSIEPKRDTQNPKHMGIRIHGTFVSKPEPPSHLPCALFLWITNPLSHTEDFFAPGMVLAPASSLSRIHDLIPAPRASVSRPTLTTMHRHLPLVTPFSVLPRALHGGGRLAAVTRDHHVATISPATWHRVTFPRIVCKQGCLSIFLALLLLLRPLPLPI